MGLTENHWEHRSFKEQGLDILPQIHLGEKASALERAGINSDRGNINREIIKHNMIILQAKSMIDETKKELLELYKTSVQDVKETIRNEVTDMIAKVAQRKGRLDLPIVSGKYLRRISSRETVQSADNAEKFATSRNIDSFESLAKFTAEREQKYSEIEQSQLSKAQRINRLKEMSKMYTLYEPYRNTFKESQSLKGLSKMKYDREHKDELAKYPELKERMHKLLGEGEKITPKQWKAEIKSLQAEYDSISREHSKTIKELAYAEVISYNKKNLERELQNESRHQTRVKRKDMEI
jgi:hypothetical protein